jgi:tetratricopeptide (TPR) repeat protein
MRGATLRRWLPAFFIGLAAAAGCASPPGPTSAPRASTPAPTASELGAEGDARFKRGDYAGAAHAYEQILRSYPKSVRIRYLLGVALAQADRVKEATAAFLWVVDHGRPDREEVRLARQWLAEARVTPTASATAAHTAQAPAPGPPGAQGQLTGRTQWDDPEHRRLSLQIVLEGNDRTTRGQRYWTKVLLNEPYEIAGVPPGRYRAMAQVGPIRLWDTWVDIKAEGPTVLDLTPANSIASPDALSPS